MGILDDAIREHIELKRKHGAASSDVERLENEAFGPPVRPGGDETGEEEIDSEAPTRLESVAAPEETEPEADSGTGEWLADFEPDAAAADAEEDAVEHPLVDSPAEIAGAEQGRVEYAELDDTVDHPAVPEPPSEEFEAFEEPSAELPAAGPEEPVEPPEAANFDHGDDWDEEPVGELEIEGEDLERPSPPPPAETEAEQQAEGDVFDDLELDLELDDEEEAAEPPVESATFEADEDDEDELEDEDEDLLEETPDFLQDTPEGERLWFEQGEPKDFDFDD